MRADCRFLEHRQQSPGRFQEIGRAESRFMHLILLNFLCMQACAAGIRIAASWSMLERGQGSWELGLLLSSSSIVPIFTAIYSGNFSDRHGYSRSMTLSVGVMALAILLAFLRKYIDGDFFLLCLAVAVAGGAANLSLIASQREVGKKARNSDERIKLFSLLGLAPSLGLALGSMYGGFLLDQMPSMYVFPLLSIWLLGCLLLPRVEGRKKDIEFQPRQWGAFQLMANPIFRRLLFANLILNGCWDFYHLAIPILGYQQGISASRIGLILGAFAVGVLTVRLLMYFKFFSLLTNGLPRLMLLAACAMAIFPMIKSTWGLSGLSFFLGAVLGATQPILMSKLYEIVVPGRLGQALALRSAGINLFATITPSVFGAAAVWGMGFAFWGIAGISALGSRLAKAPLERSEKRPQNDR